MVNISRELQPEPCILVIFGGTGDLARRKLFPALFNLYLEKQLPEQFAVVGIGRRLKDRGEYLESIVASIREFSRKTDPGHCADFLSHVHFFQMDITATESWDRLQEYLLDLDSKYHTQGNQLYYLSVAPQQFIPIVDQLKAHGMNRAAGSWRRLIIEKPFGKDLTSARQLNRKITGAFSESDIFRIDHYLGKGMLQNILVIRFANSVFEDVWNYKYIDHVQIRASEMVGVEDRGAYYDQTGALRDMVQSHLLQSLTLIAMEPPVNLSAEAIRDEKVKVIRSLAPLTPELVRKQVVRGQYAGYRQEKDVNPNSKTETFVAMKLYINNFRWAGVPFYLKTGKKLAERSMEVVVQFKKPPGVHYFGPETQLDPNLLVIKVQPEEGVFFRFNLKNLDSPEQIQPVEMDFCHNCGGKTSPEAYERLLHDAISGDSTLFTRWDEVEYSWRFVDTIAEAWQNSGEEPVIYPAGSWGPAEASELIKRDGRKWVRL
ncbi:MAG: glucose-6-phosphate dehydrogenase [Firmicutes bacterium]|nr:glucose-6-phosphate dehydrogenase [Bacillota bacterium]